MTEAQDELDQVLPLYRGLGFFARDATLSETELAAMLREQYRGSSPSGPELRTDFPGWDIALLSLDEDRTWCYDPETVYRGGNVYAELVERLGRISIGSFQPVDIEEVWDSDFGPIHLRFRVFDQQHQVDLGEMQTDFMESDVFTYIEPLIQASTPYQAVHLCTGDQTDCIVLLTDEQRDRLERERPALFDFENAYG
jgi:hypothetical protein